MPSRIAEKIAENPYVEQFYITESANMDSETISPAQTANTGGGFQRDFSSFTFSGSSQPDNLDFVLGNVTLKSGRTLTADDIKNSSNVVIISDEVATQNNLLIGDFISLYQVQAAQMMPGAGRQDNTKDMNIIVGQSLMNTTVPTGTAVAFTLSWDPNVPEPSPSPEPSPTPEPSP